MNITACVATMAGGLVTVSVVFDSVTNLVSAAYGFNHTPAVVRARLLAPDGTVVFAEPIPTGGVAAALPMPPNVVSVTAGYTVSLG